MEIPKSATPKDDGLSMTSYLFVSTLQQPPITSTGTCRSNDHSASKQGFVVLRALPVLVQIDGAVHVVFITIIVMVRAVLACPDDYQRHSLRGLIQLED